MLLEKQDCDGIVLDVEGNFWIVGYASAEILRLTPEGEIAGVIPGAGGAVTNLRFGGDDGRDLYVTSAPFDSYAQPDSGMCRFSDELPDSVNDDDPFVFAKHVGLSRHAAPDRRYGPWRDYG